MKQQVLNGSNTIGIFLSVQLFLFLFDRFRVTIERVIACSGIAKTLTLSLWVHSYKNFKHLFSG